MRRECIQDAPLGKRPIDPSTHRSRRIALAAASFVLLGGAHAAARDNKVTLHSQVEVARFLVTADRTKPGGAQLSVKRGAVIDATLSCRQDGYRAFKLGDLTFPAPLKAVMRVKAPVRDTLGFPENSVREPRAACERGDASIVFENRLVWADCKEVEWVPPGFEAPPLVFAPRLQATIECLGFSAPTEPKAALTAMTLPDGRVLTYDEAERQYRDAVPGHVVGDILKNAQPGTLPLQVCINYKAAPSVTVYTTKAPPRDFTSIRVMGHVPQTQLPGTVPMHRWYHRGEQRYVLTTDPNFDAPGNGYSDVVLEGYVFERKSARSN